MHFSVQAYLCIGSVLGVIVMLNNDDHHWPKCFTDVLQMSADTQCCTALLTSCNLNKTPKIVIFQSIRPVVTDLFIFFHPVLV